jgi:rod shape-determining protein MreC
LAAGGNNRSRLLLIILLVTSLFLITLDLRGVSLTKGSRNATQSVLAPIQRGFSDFFSPVGNFFSDIKNFGKTKAEVKDLTAENAKLKKQLVINADVQGQLTKLKGVLNLAGRGGFKVVAARVIGRGSASTFSQTITIDAGSSDGVAKDMTVMSDLGLVGVVKSVSSSSAIVLLMSDPTFRIGVRIAGSQSVGVLQGEGSSHYSLQLLDVAGTIKHHDAILSLGSDNNRPFVPGIPIGYVSSVDHKNASLTQTATVTGYSNLNALGIVSVILQAPSGDPKDSLVPKPTPTATIYVTSSAKPDTATVNTTASTTAKPSPMPLNTTKKATK